VAIIIARLLLWADFENDECVNEQVISLSPYDL
jgi:hypothetical protein